MTILPFPSFLDDVKEKGFKKAVFEGIDDSVERLTAGLNVQDLREAFRGEAASRRPNPRLTPHADGFWLHMRPSYFNRDVTGMYPSFRLGWLSSYFVFFETITGILLMLWYTPSPEIAYGDMLTILSNVPLGQLMRDMHRLGAEFMVAVVAMHTMRTWITGSYKKPRQFTWFTGLLLLVLTGFLMFLSYLMLVVQLPLENHADPQVTPLGTTAPWYFWWFQGALKLGDKFFWGVAFPTIALGGLALLPYLDVTPSRRYAHRRFMLTIACLLISVTTILSYMGLAKFAVQTSAETEIVHELTFEPAHSKVGIGRTIPFDQMIVGAYTTAQLHYPDEMSVSDAIAAINAEVDANGQYEQMITELKDQHVGANQLPLRFRAIPAAEAPTLMRVMEEFAHHLEAEPKELPNVWGALVITDNQAGLKRLDWVVSWDSVLIEAGHVQLDDNGDPILIYSDQVDAEGNPIPARRIYSDHLFIHEASAYFD